MNGVFTVSNGPKISETHTRHSHAEKQSMLLEILLNRKFYCKNSVLFNCEISYFSFLPYLYRSDGLLENIFKFLFRLCLDPICQQNTF